MDEPEMLHSLSFSLSESKFSWQNIPVQGSVCPGTWYRKSVPITGNHSGKSEVFLILTVSKKDFKLFPEINRQLLDLQCHKHCRDAILANKPSPYFQY